MIQPWPPPCASSGTRGPSSTSSASQAAGERRAALLALKAAAGPRLSWCQLKRADTHLELTDRSFHVHFDWGDRLVYLAHGLMMVLGGSTALLAAVATIWLSFRSGMKLDDTLRPSLTALLSAAGFLYATFSLGPALCALTVRRVLQSAQDGLSGSAVPPGTTLGVNHARGFPGEGLGRSLGEEVASSARHAGQPTLGASNVTG